MDRSRNTASMGGPRHIEKRRHDSDYDRSAKKPRLDHGPSSPGYHQGYSNGTQKHKQSGPSNNTNSQARKAQPQQYAASKRAGPLPPLPPITDDLAKPTFTHPSRTPREFELNVMQSYDRLEFLGDAYLEIIASRLIWSLYKDLPTGRMSSIRERLVKNETLAEFSVGYGFDKRLDIDPASMPQRREPQIKLFGDVFEAYVASVVLSDPTEGFRTLEEWLGKLWMPLLEGEQGKPPNDTWKDRLRQKVGGKKVKLDYVEERAMAKGKGIETYYIGVYLTGWGYENQVLGSGQGLSKKAAGMEAAKKALENEALIGEVCKVREEEMTKIRETLEGEAAEKEREAAQEANEIGGGE